jgi:hypothetical protein
LLAFQLEVELARAKGKKLGMDRYALQPNLGFADVVQGNDGSVPPY